MVYCDVTDIIIEAKIRPSHFGLETDEELESRVEKWAEEATSWIDEYTNTSFPDYPSSDLPRMITLACEEIIHNIVLSRRARQDNQYIKSDDWSLKSVPYSILTDEIKDMLSPYVRDKYSDSNVDFFVVVGHPLGQKKTDQVEDD